MKNRIVRMLNIIAVLVLANPGLPATGNSTARFSVDHRGLPPPASAAFR